MQECDECGRMLPTTKFNSESFSPATCFKCRVSGVRLGFAQGREMFHGDHLVGGTKKSDTEHMLKQARANGHDPVPVSTGVSHGLTSGQMARLQKTVSGA